MAVHLMEEIQIAAHMVEKALKEVQLETLWVVHEGVTLEEVQVTVIRTPVHAQAVMILLCHLQFLEEEEEFFF